MCGGIGSDRERERKKHTHSHFHIYFCVRKKKLYNLVKVVAPGNAISIKIIIYHYKAETQETEMTGNKVSGNLFTMIVRWRNSCYKNRITFFKKAEKKKRFITFTTFDMVVCVWLE